MLGEFTYQPLFPVNTLIVLGGALAALTILLYSRPAAGRLRGALLAVLRLAVVAGLIFLLARPMKDTAHGTNDGRKSFAVLLDTSKSMNTEDVDGASRLQAALTALTSSDRAFVGALEANYDVAFYEFGEELLPVSAANVMSAGEARGEKTNLAAMLARFAAEASQRPFAGALMISDGRDNVGEQIAAAANHLRTLETPVWTTTLGSDTQAGDVFLTASFAQDFVFAGQTTQLSVNITQSGYDGRYTRVDVLRESEIIQTEQVLLKSGIQRLTFPVRELEKGAYQYTVRAETLEDEADRSNNERSVFIRVVNERARVLYVEGEPYWDSKFLLRTLQADPDLDVTALFLMSPRRQKIFAITQRREANEPRSEIRMPTTTEELYQFDCVVVGRGIEPYLSLEQLQLLKSYVEERGGSIVFARGQAASGRSGILADLDPVVWDDGGLARARFELTPAGSMSPIFDFGGRDPNIVLRELPEMISISKVEQAKTMSIILAKAASLDSAEEIATISFQRYGMGKVMSVGSTGLWRWAFMKKELAHYDEIYARFWGQMVRWLIYGSEFLPGQDITFRTERHTYTLGETVPLIIQTKFVDQEHYRPELMILDPHGVATHVELQHDAKALYSYSFVPKEEGAYEALLRNNVGEPKEERVRFTVYSDALETRFVAANPALMEEIALITGASAVAPEQWPAIPRELVKLDLAKRMEVKPEDAWDKGSFFALLVGLLAVEWFVRRRTGLL
jgi:hypothetical protein